MEKNVIENLVGGFFSTLIIWITITLFASIHLIRRYVTSSFFRQEIVTWNLGKKIITHLILIIVWLLLSYLFLMTLLYLTFSFV